MASAVCSSRRSSSATNATWTTQNGTHAMGKGAVLFTGPSGIRDYKVKVVTDDRMIGIGTMSAEGSSEVNYIRREAPRTAPPTRRSAWVGEVGWMIPEFNDWRSIRSGHQMTQGEFRKAQEEKFTHRWQEPWYPAPNHPDYNKQYTFRNQQTMYGTRSKTPSPYATPPPPREAIKRPHTVASFRQEDSRGGNFPSIDNNSHHRPGSAHYSSASEHSVSSRPSSGGGGYTPIASRPPSGTSSHHSAASRSHSNIHSYRDKHSNTSYDSRQSGNRTGARRSSGSSRQSSRSRGGSKRMSATPSATSLSSQYSGGGNYR